MSGSTDNLPVLAIILGAGGVLILLAGVCWWAWARHRKNRARQEQDKVVEVTLSGGDP